MSCAASCPSFQRLLFRLEMRCAPPLLLPPLSCPKCLNVVGIRSDNQLLAARAFSKIRSSRLLWLACSKPHRAQMVTKWPSTSVECALQGEKLMRSTPKLNALRRQRPFRHHHSVVQFAILRLTSSASASSSACATMCSFFE